MGQVIQRSGSGSFQPRDREGKFDSPNVTGTEEIRPSGAVVKNTIARRETDPVVHDQREPVSAPRIGNAEKPTAPVPTGRQWPTATDVVTNADKPNAQGDDE